MKKEIVVIGGGLAGLSGAIYLAKMGFRVRLFEKNSTLGGKANQVEKSGYRFDTGPSLITMPFIIQELYSFAGFDIEKQLNLVPVEPICRYFFPDGSILDTSADLHRMRHSLDNFSFGSAESFDRFIDYSATIYKTSAPVFLFLPIHELSKIFKIRHIPLLLHLHLLDPFHTVHQAVSRYFKDERLVQLFDRYATYNGSDPFQAPATLNIIPYVEYVLGSFYIKGGIYCLVRSLQDMARQLGVEIHMESPVDRIIDIHDSISGVRVNGDVVRADAVLCNGDVVTSFSNLIDGHTAYKKTLQRLEPSLSGIVFLWGIRRKNDKLAHHNIFFSKNYRKEFQQIFHQGEVPDDPTIYISISSKTDAEHAPHEGENWFVLINSPCLGDGRAFDLDDSRNRILSAINACGISVTAADIETETVLTPDDFARLYLSNRGSIYGISSNSRSMAFRRPPNRDRHIKGLYFAGGSSHPGGGVPLVLLSGRLAAQLIHEKYG